VENDAQVNAQSFCTQWTSNRASIFRILRQTYLSIVRTTMHHSLVLLQCTAGLNLANDGEISLQIQYIQFTI